MLWFCLLEWALVEPHEAAAGLVEGLIDSGEATGLVEGHIDSWRGC